MCEQPFSFLSLPPTLPTVLGCQGLPLLSPPLQPLLHLKKEKKRGREEKRTSG